MTRLLSFLIAVSLATPIKAQTLPQAADANSGITTAKNSCPHKVSPKTPAASTLFEQNAASSRINPLDKNTIPDAWLGKSACDDELAHPLESSASLRKHVFNVKLVDGIIRTNFDNTADGAAAMPVFSNESLTVSQSGVFRQAPDVPRQSSGQTDSRPASQSGGISVPPAKAPRYQKAENIAFWSTWWGYHAAWAADFTTTGIILSRGGHERANLYAQFGNRNMAGVIGSAAAFHAATSVGAWYLHRKAMKSRGFKRFILEAAAIGSNGYGIGIHSSAAAGNVRVLRNWSSR